MRSVMGFGVRSGYWVVVGGRSMCENVTDKPSKIVVAPRRRFPTYSAMAWTMSLRYTMGFKRTRALVSRKL